MATQGISGGFKGTLGLRVKENAEPTTRRPATIKAEDRPAIEKLLGSKRALPPATKSTGSILEARKLGLPKQFAGAPDLAALTLEMSNALDQIAPTDKLHSTSWKAMNAAAIAIADQSKDNFAALDSETRTLAQAIEALVTSNGLAMPLVKQRKAKTLGDLFSMLKLQAPADSAAEVPQDRWLDIREAAIRVKLSQLLSGALDAGGALSDVRLTTRKNGAAPSLVLDVDIDPFKSGAIKQLKNLLQDFSAAYGPRFDLRLEPDVAHSLSGRPAWEGITALEGKKLGKILTDSDAMIYHSDDPISTQQNLVVLDHAVEHVKKEMGEEVFENHVIVAIPHLLKDVEAFVNAFLETGADPAHLSLLGIPYSTKFVEVPRLRRIGVTDVQTPESYDDFLKLVPGALEEAVIKAKNNGKKVLIIEDGGYFAPWLHSDEGLAMLKKHGYSSPDQIIDGIVEQTSNGLWRDQKITNLATEILSVPDLALKQEIEPPFVGTAVADNVAKLVGKLGDSVKGRQTLVLSYGNIGEEVVQAFQGKQAVVSAWDIKPLSRVKARNAGHETKKDATELFQEAWLIVGASGSTSINTHRLDEIIDNSDHQRVYLASGSSKRIEIDTKHLEFRASAVKKLSIDGEHLGTLYTFDNGREIAVLADGYPVNFFGQDAQSVPSEHIAPVLAALYLSAVQLVTKEEKKVGIHAPDPWIEELATSAYEKFLDA